MLQRLSYGLLLVGIAVFFMGAQPALADNGHHYRSPRYGNHQGYHQHYGGYYRVPVYQPYRYYRPGYYGYYRPHYSAQIILPLPPLPFIVFGPSYR